MRLHRCCKTISGLVKNELTCCEFPQWEINTDGDTSSRPEVTDYLIKCCFLTLSPCVCPQATEAAASLIMPLCMSLISRPCQACSYTLFSFFTHPHLYRMKNPVEIMWIFLPFFFFNGLIKAYTFWLADCHRLVSAMTACRLCGRDHCLHWKDAGLSYWKNEQTKPKMKKTKNRKCVMTWLYLDSSIKPAGCRRCILGSSTLVFVWEGVPACGGDFFFSFFLLRMYTNEYFYYFMLIIKKYCICIQSV